MSIEIERKPQQGSEGVPGATPETLKIHSRDASQTEYVTTLTRWGDDPFEVEKRVKKRGTAGNRTIKQIVPKLTPKIREVLDERGYDY